jgi:CysZ protein
LKGRFLWFFVPGLVFTAAYWITQYYVYKEYEYYQLSSDIGFLNTFYEWINYGTSLIYSAIEWLLEKIYVFLVLTLLAPLNAFLGERLDRRLTGTEFPYSFQHFVKDFFRMLLIVTIALFFEIITIFIWFVFSFVFGLGALDDIIYFIISAFYYGFAFHDYALERYRLSVGKSIGFAFRHPFTMMCTGAIFLGVFAIPYFGVPSSSVLTTMVATVVYLHMTKKLQLQA